MARIVMLQLCAAFIIAIFAWVFSRAAGVSALLGGLCYALPNALFALRLYVGAHKASGVISTTKPKISPATFFIGEFLKLLTVIALLVAVVWWYHDLNWPAFLIGFVVVLKSYFILLFRNKL